MENIAIIDYYSAMEVIRQKTKESLKKSEQYFKTDMVYLAKGSFWLTLGQVISIGVGLTTAYVFANHIPPNVYGTYKYLLSVVGLLSVFTLTGIGPMISQATARGMEGSLFEGLRTKIRYGMIGGLASACTAAYYYTHGNTELALAFTVAAIFIPFMDSFQIYQDYLQGKRNFEYSIKYSSMSQLIGAAAMVATVFVTHNLYLILLAYFASWTFSRLFFLRRTLKRFPPNNLVDPHTIPYAKNSSLIDLFASFVGSIDQILIFHFVGSVELAIYSFAIAPITQLVSPFRNIPILAMPKLANRPIEEINSMLKKRIALAFGVGTLLATVYYFFAPFFYTLFFPKYIASIRVSRLYALTMLFTIPNTILGSAVNAKVTSIPKKMLWLWNIPGIFSTLFILLTIQKLGIASVAIARILLVCVSFTIGFGMWLYVLRKETSSTSDTNLSYPVYTDLN